LLLLIFLLAKDSKLVPMTAQQTTTSAIETGKTCMYALKTTIGCAVTGFLSDNLQEQAQFNTVVTQIDESGPGGI
jgi:hypothetical protein